jgi:hypothetical protein
MEMLLADNRGHSFTPVDKKTKGFKERMRRRIVALVFIVYWLLIFEGAIRRWVFPSHDYLFFFIRDPFVLWIYWIAFRFRLWPKSWSFLNIGMGFAFLSVFLIYIQMLSGGYDQRHLLLAAYGWRNYFFYMPLAFIIAEHFRRSDINRLLRHSLIIAVLSAVLVTLQFNSPATAVVNLGAALDEAHQFLNLGAALGYVRPTGFFTSTAGQSDFVASLVAMMLALWVIPKRERPIPGLLLILGTVSTVAMMAMSGSRSLFFLTGICVLTALFSGFVVLKPQLLLRSCLVPVLFVLALVFLYPVLFPTPFEVFMTRWSDAYAFESQIFQYGIFGRTLLGLYDFVFIMGDTPPQGYLLGMGGNAAERLSWVQYPEAAQDWSGYGGWIESGWARHIAELGPAMGLLFILYRVGFTLWLGWNAVQATRKHKDPLPLILFGFVGVLLFYGQITGHGTHNGYVWLFVGFCLAACRSHATLGRKLRGSARPRSLLEYSRLFTDKIYDHLRGVP